LPEVGEEEFQGQQMELLRKIADEYTPCIIIDLKLSNPDVVRRRAGFWYDPVSGECYPAQQVLYSRKRRHEGWVSGEPDPVFLQEESQMLLDFLKITPQKPVEKERESADDDEEEEADADAEKEEKKPERHVFNIVNRKSYPILADDVLDR
jgi:hypothetical protein